MLSLRLTALDSIPKRMRSPSALALALAAFVVPAAADILIVADEFPAMAVLSRRLKETEGITSRVMAQTNMPAELAAFSAVIVYIHRELKESAENAFIGYAENGGKLVALHHSISSGKRQNAHWFKFLGVDLPPGEVGQGGYKWIEPATVSFVNLAPDHFIMTNQVRWPETVPFTTEAATVGTQRPGFTLHDSEVYLNHKLLGPRTILMGFRYVDPTSGKLWMQDRAGWVKPAGRGWIIYLEPGHSAKDFESPVFSRLVLNAVIWQPPR